MTATFAVSSGSIISALGYQPVSPTGGAITGALTVGTVITVNSGMPQSAIQSILTSGAVSGATVVFGPGTYNLAPTSGANFTLTNPSNLNIVGYGATFLVTGTDTTTYGSAVFYSQNGSGLQYEGFTIDYLHPPFLQTTCVSVGSGVASFDIGPFWAPTFSDIYRIEQVDSIDHLVLTVNTFGPGSGAGFPISLVSGTVYQVSGLASGVTAGLVTGGNYILTHRPYGSNCLTIDGTAKVTVKNVNLLKACGMGIYARLNDDITIERTDTYLDANSIFWRSLNSDGRHIENGSSQVRLYDNRLQRMGDDCVNVVTRAYQPTVTGASGFTITVEDSRLLTSVNDAITFVNVSGITQGSGAISSVVGNGTTTRNISLQSAAPSGFDGTWWVGLLRYAPKITSSRNIYGYNRGRGFIGPSRHVTSADDQFYSTFEAAIEVGSSPYAVGFNETSLSPTAIRILNPVINNCGTDRNNAPAVIIVAANIPGTTTPTAFGGGFDVLVSNPAIRNCPNAGIYIAGFSGATIIGGAFNNASNNPNGSLLAGLTTDPIVFNNCDALTARGNVCVSGANSIGMQGTIGSTTDISLNTNMPLNDARAAVARIINSRNSGGTGNAVLSISAGGSSGGDAQIQIGSVGVGSHVIDSDTSDNGRLKGSFGTFDGSSPYLVIEKTGQFYPAIRSYITGLLLTNNAATSLFVGAGFATDSTNTRPLIGTAGTIDCTVTGANGLDTGTLSGPNTYFAHIIGKTDSTTAYLASLSSGAPTLPSGYTLFRCIGAAIADATPHFYPVNAELDGQTNYFTSTTFEFTTTGLASSATLLTLSGVPVGIKVKPIMRMLGFSFPSMISSPDMPDLAPVASGTFSTGPGFTLSNVSNTTPALVSHFFTNASGQIRARGQSTNTGLTIYVDGWIWDRGAHA